MQGKPDALKVMTLNLRCCVAKDPSPNSWEERWPRIQAFLREEKPALFGVQEGCPPQVEAIADGTDYRFIGSGRDDFRTKGEFSCIFYAPERLEVLDFGNFALAEDPAVPCVKAWGAACPRMATWGFFRDLANGQRFCCYNTHLDHISELAQINGLELILKQMAGRYAEAPQILMGDFNVTPDSPVWTRASAALADARTIALDGAQGPATTYHGWGKEAKEIDYIFVSQGLTVLEFRTEVRPAQDGQMLSDHYPVLATLKFGVTHRPLVVC